MKSRIIELVLGLVGGILGIVAALLVVFLGKISETVLAFLTGTIFGDAYDGSAISNRGWFALLISVIAIVGSVLVRSKAKVGGWIMIISGIVGYLAINIFYVISSVLLIIAGLMGIFRKSKSA